MTNPNGYDFTIGNSGFRFATDTNSPYQRYTEPVTAQRFDNSKEPGEQSLSALPWIKSQDSFHAGAGQLNLEKGYTDFQYQQEQVSHLRFDTSLGADVWTPGQVSRLPETLFTSIPSGTVTCAVSGTQQGKDYVIAGGSACLYQIAWPNGADLAPTITAIDLSGPQFGGMSNCVILSLATDGRNYYALIKINELTEDGNSLTQIVRGPIYDTVQPTTIYRITTENSPAANGVTLPVVRTNLITNPNFDHGNITGWTSTQGGTLAVSTTQKHSGTSSLSAPTGAVPTYTKTNVTPGETISFSCYVWTSAAGAKVNTTLDFLDSSSNVIWSDGGGWVSIPASQWTRVAVTTVVPVNAATVEPSIVPFDNFSYYLDDALLEVSPDVGVYFDGDSGDSVMMYDVAGNLVPHTAAWSGTVGASTSNLTANYQQLPYLGVLGWAKARLMASLGNNIYELDPEGGEMPDPKYINPATTWTGTAIAESPQGVLVAGDAQGSNVSILEFTLDSTGGVPVLSGGSTVANLPAGESIKAMSTYMGSFLVIGTAKGIRVGTFDTTYGSLTVGPLTVPTNRPALAVAGRDRFAYGSFTDQQEDGSTGIVRMDLSYVIDSAGRLAHAPDLRPAADAAIKTGDVVSIQPLPGSGRLCFLTASGIYVEGDGPSTTGDAWLRTSRIRYDTTTLKLWTKGRVLGDPESGFSVEITRASGSTDSHTEVDDTTGEFDFDTDLDSWIRVKINLGPGSTLSSYEVSALPAPKRQHMILCSALCYTSEKDRWDNVRVDPDSPRTRWNNVTALEEAGNELVFTEYASDGTTSSDNVVIDQLQFQATSPPQKSDDFGGIITFKLRIVD